MIESVTELVQKILIKYPATRDNDRYLTVMVWRYEKPRSVETAEDLMKAYAQEKLSNHDTITRARRKLQELHPELRGNKYKERQEVLEPKVREEIKNYESRPPSIH